MGTPIVDILRVFDPSVQKPAHCENVAQLSDYERRVFEDCFDLCDADSGGTVSFEELVQALDEMDVIPPSGVCREALRRAMQARLDQGQEELSVDDFVIFVEQLFDEVLWRYFWAYDEGNNNVLTVRSLGYMLFEMGEAWNWVEVEQLAAETHDADKDAMNYEEFCLLIRSVRERHLTQYRQTAGFRPAKLEVFNKLFKRYNTNNVISIEKMLQVLNDLGRVPVDDQEQDALFTILARTDRDKTGKFDNEEYLHVLRCWLDWLQTHKPHSLEDKHNLTKLEMEDFQIAMENRWISTRAGISAFEVEVLRDYFELHDEDGSGEVENHELQAVMEDMSFHNQKAALARIKVLAEELDVDSSGSLDFEEFTICLTTYYREAMNQELDQLPKPVSTAEHLGDLVSHLCNCTAKTYMFLNRVQEKAPAHLDEDSLWKILSEVREFNYQEYRLTAGYQPFELEVMKDAFKQFDKDHSGQISFSELTAVLGSMNKLPKSKDEQNRLMALIRRIDDGSGELDFTEFLRLLRTWDNTAKREEVKRELAVGEECGFRHEQTRRAKEIFSLVDQDNSRVLEPSEVRILLQRAGVNPKPQEMQEILIWAADFAQHKKKCWTLDMCGFLRLWKKLMEHDIVGDL